MITTETEEGNPTEDKNPFLGDYRSASSEDQLRDELLQLDPTKLKWELAGELGGEVFLYVWVGGVRARVGRTRTYVNGVAVKTPWKFHRTGRKLAYQQQKEWAQKRQTAEEARQARYALEAIAAVRKEKDV